MRTLALVLLALGFLAACAPTYPKDKIAESVVRMCQEEYKVPVQVGISGSTIGVLISAEHLFEGLPPVIKEEDLEVIAQTLQFSEAGRETIGDVSLALARVCLSSDAPLEFYTIVARDVLSGLEFIWSGYLDDQKRVSVDVSRGDFLQYRTPISFRIQPERVTRAMMEDFLKELPVQPVAHLLRRYVSTTAVLDEILPSMLEITTDLVSSNPQLEEIHLYALQTAAQEILLVLRFGKAGDPMSRTYLVTAELPTRGALVRRIESLGNVLALPSPYQALGAPETWEQKFYVEPMRLPQFLADQIARRIRIDLTAQGGLHPLELAVVGDFQDRSFDFHFRFLRFTQDLGLHQPEQGKDASKVEVPDSSDELALAVAKTAAEVVKSYGFSDFQNIRITDLLKGTHWMVSADQLPLYRRRNPPPLTPLP